MLSTRIRESFFFSLAILGLVAGGCGSESAKGPEGSKAAASSADSCAVAGWCTEHRVPEELCAQCDAKVAAEYQQKGDWCKEHERPMSQCFLCDPKLEAKFAADYEAKYGKQPPQAEDRKP
jgi:hypothetical protein